MTFSKANTISLCAIMIYFAWWLYLVFDSNKTGYDNHYAGAIMVQFYGAITLVLTGIYILCFLIAAMVTKKWKKYFLFIPLTVVPILLLVITYKNWNGNAG